MVFSFQFSDIFTQLQPADLQNKVEETVRHIFQTAVSLSSAEALPQTRRKAREKKKSGASATKCAVLGRKVAVSAMRNNNNGTDSRSRICTVMHGVGFIMEPGGRAEPEFLRIQTSLLQHWNYKILKID